MSWLFGKSNETRESLENPKTPFNDENINAFVIGNDGPSNFDPVTIDSALTIPAVWSAVNFLAGTLAGLPLNLFSKRGENRKKVSSPLSRLLHDFINDEMSSFDWRKQFFEDVFTHGRGVAFIERTTSGTIINIWPLHVENLTLRRKGGRKEYVYQDGRRTLIYKAADVIDVPFMLKRDRLTARSPIYTNQETLGLSIAITKYGGRFFRNGGVPPFAIEGNFETPGAMQRAVNQLGAAVKKAAQSARLALALPAGHKIVSIGADAEKAQLIDSQRFQIEQAARIWQLPPVFLQDLTHGTFSNTEQQDLNFVKHTLKRWVEQFEQELNLKLFGRKNRKKLFVELNVDGLLRGDFKTRMDGYATAIQNAILKPNEVRSKENLEKTDEGKDLMIQGGTVPVGSQTNATPSSNKNLEKDNDDVKN